MLEPAALQQISLSLTAERNAIAPATAVSSDRRNRDLQQIREAIKRANDGEGITFDLHERLSPFNIAISQRFADHVRHLHRLIDKALVDIIGRWTKDTKANFLARMPLEKHEEDLLRWFDGPGRKVMRPFSKAYGAWRTDYMIEQGHHGYEHAIIIELNSRIAFNGLTVVGLHETATQTLAGEAMKVQPANDYETTKRTVFDLFDTRKPLFHIREKWPGVDSHILAREYQQRFGQPMITVKPSDLRVLPDDRSPTGYSLYYCADSSTSIDNHKQQVNGGEHEQTNLQKIEQCSLELFQEEYEMDPLILQQISTMCVNDFRNVFLIHDKRILGIIEEELPNLHDRQVLTSEECFDLSNGIAQTLLAGTSAMKVLLDRSRQNDKEKDAWIIKPVRDAMCHGIKLGKNISQQEWLDLLERHADHALLPSEGACVVQRLVDHIWYDIVRHHEGDESVQAEKFHLIGSMHMINSKLEVFGPWRLGEEVHVGFTEEGNKGIVMSSVIRPKGVEENGESEA